MDGLLPPGLTAGNHETQSIHFQTSASAITSFLTPLSITPRQNATIRAKKKEGGPAQQPAYARPPSQPGRMPLSRQLRQLGQYPRPTSRSNGCRLGHQLPSATGRVEKNERSLAEAPAPPASRQPSPRLVANRASRR